jgi:D-sedoheptulose 7-phosphate isomerase
MSVNPDSAIASMLERYPMLGSAAPAILEAAAVLTEAARRDALIMACGNGGSAADADHLAAELVKGFLSPRPLDESTRAGLAAGGVAADLVSRLQQPVRAVSLSANTALLTAILNDQGADAVYAQQVLGYGRTGDVLVCISTSGASPNVVAAAVLARARGLSVIALVGPDASLIRPRADLVIQAPGTNAGEIQDLHRPIIHALCAQLETTLFG